MVGMFVHPLLTVSGVGGWGPGGGGGGGGNSSSRVSSKDEAHRKIPPKGPNSPP